MNEEVHLYAQPPAGPSEDLTQAKHTPAVFYYNFYLKEEANSHDFFNCPIHKISDRTLPYISGGQRFKTRKNTDR